MHHCDYAFPTLAQAIDASKYLYVVASGSEPKETGPIAHCLGCVVMYAISYLDSNPHPQPVPAMAESSGNKLNDLVTALGPLASSTSTSDAIPWKTILALAMELLKEWLNK